MSMKHLKAFMHLKVFSDIYWIKGQGTHCKVISNVRCSCEQFEIQFKGDMLL